MNIHVRYKAGKTPEIERELQHQVEKLQRRLQVFKPDLVHLHAIVDEQNGQGASTSLNLRLPSGQMAVQNWQIHVRPNRRFGSHWRPPLPATAGAGFWAP